jgi:hypothetical protein
VKGRKYLLEVEEEDDESDEEEDDESDEEEEDEDDEDDDENDDADDTEESEEESEDEKETGKKRKGKVQALHAKKEENRGKKDSPLVRREYGKVGNWHGDKIMYSNAEDDEKTRRDSAIRSETLDVVNYLVNYSNVEGKKNEDTELSDLLAADKFQKKSRI